MKNNILKCDLAVVGAGPAGLLTSILAVKAGFKVIVLEKKVMPRRKPCGGFISTRSLNLLPSEFLISSDLGIDVNSIKIITKEQTYCYQSETSLGFLCKREDFDQRLANYASSQGVLIIEDWALHGIDVEQRTKTKSQQYKLNPSLRHSTSVCARYVVGADGALSRVTQLTGLRKKAPSVWTGWGLTATSFEHPKKEHPGTLIFHPKPLLKGMGWQFIGPGWCNIGIGGLTNRRRLEKEYRRLFSQHHSSISLMAWPLPFLGPLRQAGSGNLLLVGDAAGLVEPYTGEGLYNSFFSAILAISAIKKAAQDNRAAALIYQDLYNKNFRRPFPKVLLKAAALNLRSSVKPSSLPSKCASIMKDCSTINQASVSCLD